MLEGRAAGQAKLAGGAFRQIIVALDSWALDGFGCWFFLKEKKELANYDAACASTP